ncbi:L-asparaginase [Yersinia enterocolitica]|nr:L-asparaginase [Yersinia enterocolitica]
MLLNQAILLAILSLGSARTPHVLQHVRSGFCALSALKLPATIMPD